MNKYFVKLINCATKLCVQISGEFHVIRLEEHFCCLCLSKDLELYRTVIFSSFCICRRCSCLNFTLCVAVEVDTKMNFILSSILVIIITVPELYSDRIECVWGYQFLCGDKCLSLDSQCQCGNERIYYNETQYFNCCNDGTCNFDYTGNVNCIGGKNVLENVNNMQHEVGQQCHVTIKLNVSWLLVRAMEHLNVQSKSNTY